MIDHNFEPCPKICLKKSGFVDDLFLMLGYLAKIELVSIGGRKILAHAHSKASLGPHGTTTNNLPDTFSS